MLVAGRFHHLRVCFSLRSTNRSVEFHPSLLRCWLSPVWYLFDINITNYGIIDLSNIKAASLFLEKNMSDVGGVDRGVIVVAGYTVKATGDEDGHLTLTITHSDGSQVRELYMDLGFDDPWAERFSTALIEDSYSHSIMGDK